MNWKTNLECDPLIGSYTTLLSMKLDTIYSCDSSESLKMPTIPKTAYLSMRCSQFSILVGSSNNHSIAGMLFLWHQDQSSAQTENLQRKHLAKHAACMQQTYMKLQTFSAICDYCAESFLKFSMSYRNGEIPSYISYFRLMLWYQYTHETRRLVATISAWPRYCLSSHVDNCRYPCDMYTVQGKYITVWRWMFAN